MKPGLLAIMLLTSCLTAEVPIPDWGDCQDELDRTRRAAFDASSAAEKLKSTLDDFEECKRDPEIQDLFHDGRRSHRSDYESALGNFKDEMGTLDSRLSSVQSSCGYEFTINGMSSVQAAEERLCFSYKSSSIWDSTLHK